MASEEQTLLGVDVLSVYINGENPSRLYGKIIVDDGLGPLAIYNRSRENAEYIGPGRTALLISPPRHFSGYDNFTIDVALVDRDDQSSLDDELLRLSNNRQVFHWDNYSLITMHGRPLSEDKIEGKYGSATVNFMVLLNAVNVTVEVTLIKGDGEPAANVYGLLAASIGKFRSYESVLFRRSWDEDIKVEHGKPIPLSRFILTVPFDSSLIVRADLMDKDTDPSANDEIAKGTAEFDAQLSGTSTNSIYGEYNEIQVKVTWMNW